MTSKSGPIARALAESLKIADVQDRDGAGVALARRLAQLLDASRGTGDEADVFNDLAPKYLATLTALGLTPAARGTKGGTASGSSGSSKLDELRARRQRGTG